MLNPYKFQLCLIQVKYKVRAGTKFVLLKLDNLKITTRNTRRSNNNLIYYYIL